MKKKMIISLVSMLFLLLGSSLLEARAYYSDRESCCKIDYCKRDYCKRDYCKRDYCKIDCCKIDCCKFYIKNNTNSNLAVQRFDANGTPLRLIKIRRGRRKMLRGIPGMSFDLLAIDPCSCNRDYRKIAGRFILNVCPDCPIAFCATDFIHYSGVVPNYFTTDGTMMPPASRGMSNTQSMPYAMEKASGGMNYETMPYEMEEETGMAY
jgi:hypothetical protein